MGKNVLAIDLGASNGRVMLCKFDGNKILLEEIHRFDNNPFEKDGTLYWDIDSLFEEIKIGLKKAGPYQYESMGIDTWGVDFGLIGKNGKLLGNPVHYRDKRTTGVLDKAFSIMPREELFLKTGTQIMEINTLFQLLALKNNNPDIFENVENALFMPDLFAWLLTGEKNSELSIASTSQMLDINNKIWNDEIFEAFGMPKNIFPPLIKSGACIGELLPHLADELGTQPKKVIAVCGHDTACAVMSVPADSEDFIFISCGTWSLIGTETYEPKIDKGILEKAFTNEIGYNSSIEIIGNLTGLWLIQEARRYYKSIGSNYSYSEMEKMASNEEPFTRFIDTDAPEFSVSGNIPEAVNKYLSASGQPLANSPGEIIRCIYDSLALKYKVKLAQLNSIKAKAGDTIYMVGGGIQAELLCKLASDICSCRVVAGPIEATSLGNAAIQLIALGYIKDMQEARAIIKSSFQPKEFFPSTDINVEGIYKKYINTISEKSSVK